MRYLVAICVSWLSACANPEAGQPLEPSDIPKVVARAGANETSESFTYRGELVLGPRPWSKPLLAPEVLMQPGTLQALDLVRFEDGPAAVELRFDGGVAPEFVRVYDEELAEPVCGLEGDPQTCAAPARGRLLLDLRGSRFLHLEDLVPTDGETSRVRLFYKYDDTANPEDSYMIFQRCTDGCRARD